jgi:membrane associated rhomboid family serine protease
MQRPPSPAKCLRYPITTSLAVLAIVATLQAWFWPDIANIELFRSETGNCVREPWRLFTGALYHGHILHLFFDVCWLWAFGTLVEDGFGHVATLGIYCLLGAGSTAAELALFHGGIGLSGIVYGLFGLLWVLSRTNPRFHNAVDHKVIELMTGWFILCIVLTIAEVWTIALVAHGAGCILGALLGWAIGAPSLAPRLRRSTILAVAFLLCLAGGTVARHYVNLVGDEGSAWADQGRAALEAGDTQQAIDRYEQAIAANPKLPVRGWWTGLGVAYQQAGRSDDARRAFAHAKQSGSHASESE